jgi:hypothetical protein
MAGQWVEIEFDCLPLRSLPRLVVPADASPGFARLIGRIQQAVDQHGTHNAYYLHRAKCCFHVTNDPQVGMLAYTFEGTVLTDAEDRRVRACDLQVKLQGETCEWLTEPIVQWFTDSVPRAVMVEFDRYIAAGDLARTEARLRELQAQSDAAGGFVGMFL